MQIIMNKNDSSNENDSSIGTETLATRQQFGASWNEEDAEGCYAFVVKTLKRKFNGNVDGNASGRFNLSLSTAKLPQCADLAKIFQTNLEDIKRLRVHLTSAGDVIDMLNTVEQEIIRDIEGYLFFFPSLFSKPPIFYK